MLSWPVRGDPLFNAKKFKQRQAIAWGSLANVYDYSFSTLGHPAAMQMILEAGIKEGDTVLDVASGTGIDAFLAVPIVGQSGRIVGIDIAPQMVEVANQKVQKRGFANVGFEVMDAENMSFKPSTFDAAIAKWALVSMPDSHRALKEILRVLKPGGRLSAIVFGRTEASAFITVGARAAFKHMASLVTGEAEGPTDFQFGGEGALEAAFNTAGFVNVKSRRLALIISCKDGEAYWNLLLNGAGNLSYKINNAPPGLKEAVHREVVQAVERYLSPDGIRLPLEVVLGYGERPGREIEAPRAPPKVRSLEEILEEEAKDVAEITPQDAAKLLRDHSVAFVDVRRASRYAEAHLPRALSTPRGEMEAVIDKHVLPQATRQVVVYDEDGRSARLAARSLAEMGYRSAVALSGGFQGWIAAKLPTQSGAMKTTKGLFAQKEPVDEL
jgi:ubiquinone/menaquinone biosynthesis C-methylase UbiE/rhodanese-related sulfurtransferase